MALDEWLIDYLLLNLVQRIRTVDCEAYAEYVRVRIAQGPESIIIFLSCSIPKGAFELYTLDCKVCNIIFKDRWYIYLSK